MPLAPRYTWEQDASSLGLELQLPGIALRHIDIYVSDLVIKINAAPYVLLLDLYDAVDDASTIVKSHSASNVLRITVKKVHPRVWHELQFRGSKSGARERREASMERKRVCERALSEKRKEKRHAEEKETLRAQMAVDDTNRQILTDLKADEKDREERSLYESIQHLHVQKEKQMEKLELEQKRAQKKVCKPSNRDLAMPKNHPNGSKSPSDCLERKGSGVSSRDDVIELTADGSFDISHTQQHPKSGDTGISAPPNDAKAQKVHPHNAVQMSASNETSDDLDVPPPRPCVQSQLCFTPRVFPTPSRESKAMEEENWLLKNRKYLHHHANLARSATADISETDPMWLKAKGDDFFHAKDFASAIHAYTDALNAGPRHDTVFLATCVSNRAACLLASGNFEECVNDCTTALTYLPDTRDATDRAIPSHRLKLKLFVRRGTAACRLGRYDHARADYSVACTLDPRHPHLQEDLRTLVAMATAQEWKRQGDDLVKNGHDVATAIDVYSKALQLHPCNIASLSNRAACYLMQQRAMECIQDCTQALALLQRDVAQAPHVVEFAAYPATGSLARREWVVKTLVRRATAFALARDWDRAEQDFAASVELDPSNEALQADLANVRNERKQLEVKCDVPPLRV